MSGRIDPKRTATRTFLCSDWRCDDSDWLPWCHLRPDRVLAVPFRGCAGHAMNPALPDVDAFVSSLLGSTTEGRHEWAMRIEAWAQADAGRVVGGVKAGAKATQRSLQKRRAVFMAAGLEPMAAGPIAGKCRAGVPLGTVKWAVDIVTLIGRNPEHFGVDRAPSIRFVEGIHAELSAAAT